MKCRVIRETEYVTTQWAGGKTSQIVISPADAVFAERTFDWRISRATVEAQESNFTRMPGFKRFLYLINGDTKLHYHGTVKNLKPESVICFDGGLKIRSVGQGTDLNLIMNENTEGYIEQKKAAPGEDIEIENLYGADYCLIYMLRGQIRVSGQTVHELESIACNIDNAEGFTVRAEENSKFVCFYTGKKGNCHFPKVGEELL